MFTHMDSMVHHITRFQRSLLFLQIQKRADFIDINNSLNSGGKDTIKPTVIKIFWPPYWCDKIQFD